ncbi:MAG: sugar phosphate nucleotidyltransferase [Bacteroidota bacterium]|nr:sugar phosphate nucleotidyltransferase [Bacteroidota bacterium]MEC8636636.1 sugar phosphate nucleotidyltransferase [Bacteroidota bacterium]
MKIIVPMAGRGSRLRPHSITIPKPMLPVAGSPIVSQLVNEIARVVDQPIEEVAYILGDPAFFGPSIVEELTQVAQDLGAKATIYRQLEPLGTGHAVMCAADSLSGPLIVAYADTLIRTDLSLDPTADGMIWVKKVENPTAYGVVKMNEDNHITALVEKPQEFVSDLAVIGIYYFKEGQTIKAELKKNMTQARAQGEEFLLNEGILAMMGKGAVFTPGAVKEWMDCGNPKITLQTNTKMLDILMEEGNKLIAEDVITENSQIIPPCYIGPGVVLKNSKVGPHTAIGEGTKIENSVITKSLVQKHSLIQNAQLEGAMIGNHVKYDGTFKFVSIGDYSELSHS